MVLKTPKVESRSTLAAKTMTQNISGGSGTVISLQTLGGALIMGGALNRQIKVIQHRNVKAETKASFGHFIEEWANSYGLPLRPFTSGHPGQNRFEFFD